MATIGSLAVNLLARTEKFSKGLHSARRDLGLFGKGVSSAQQLVVGFGATLAAGFTVGRLRQAADEIDNLTDRAETLGVTFEKLQRLNWAAKLGGADEGSLTSALAKMRRGLVEGNDGFVKLGLNIDRLRSMKGEEVFLKIADAIKQIEDPNERLSAARKIFGRPGESLMPTLLGGSAGITEQMGQIRTISTESAQGVKRFNDATDKLSQSADHLTKSVVVSLAPALERLAVRVDKFLNVGAAPSGLSGKIAEMSEDKFKSFADRFGKGDDVNRWLAAKDAGLGLNAGQLRTPTFKDTLVPPPGMHETQAIGELMMGKTDTVSQIESAIAERVSQRSAAIQRFNELPGRGIGQGLQQFNRLIEDGSDGLAKLRTNLHALERWAFWATTRKMFSGDTPLGSGGSRLPTLPEPKLLPPHAADFGDRLSRGESRAARRAARERVGVLDKELRAVQKQQLEEQKAMRKALEKIEGKNLGAQLLPANLV